MKRYEGSCHCGSITFVLSAQKIDKGLRCNCSICERKGAVMTPFTIAPEDLEINAKGDSLATYEFGSGVAKHHFCRKCGIYVFHQTMREPGRYRVNVGCIEEINSLQLPVETFNGANI